MNAVYCELDAHKESTYATVLESTGQVVTQRRVGNEEVPEFLQSLLRALPCPKFIHV